MLRQGCTPWRLGACVDSGHEEYAAAYLVNPLGPDRVRRSSGRRPPDQRNPSWPVPGRVAPEHRGSQDLARMGAGTKRCAERPSR